MQTSSENSLKGSVTANDDEILNDFDRVESKEFEKIFKKIESLTIDTSKTLSLDSNIQIISGRR